MTEKAPLSHRDTCRLCGGTELSRVLSLPPTPPANAFVAENRLAEPQPAYPLDVWFCEGCAHVQLLDVVDPRVLYEEYVYVSGTSPVFVAHFTDYAASVIADFELAPDDLVVDIGSNDGTLLKFFKTAGYSVLGIDPAVDIARQATEYGIETRPEFFTRSLAEMIRKERGPAAAITANNVFAHTDDLSEITEGVHHLLHDDGLFVFEVSYLVDVVGKVLFDMIYHEHLAYHTVKPLRQFLTRYGLELFQVQRVDTHGGSIRVYAQHKGGPYRADGSVEALIELEAQCGLDRAKTFKDFATQIDSLKTELGGVLRSLCVDGRSIAGFGAPAKATTLMYHFDLGPEIMSFIVDDNPLKQGLYSPGMHIPILPSSELYRRQPDYTVVLAWNFANSILKDHTKYQSNGGHFIVPLPKLVTY